MSTPRLTVWRAEKLNSAFYVSCRGELWIAWAWTANPTSRPTKLHEEGYRWELAGLTERAEREERRSKREQLGG